MRPVLQLLLLLAIASITTACPSRRSGGGGGDDDDSAADDDDLADDDDATADDDDLADDDDVTQGDDDDTPGGTQVSVTSGTRVVDVDFGPKLEAEGLTDCHIELDVVNSGLSAPAGCPSCAWLVAVTFEVAFTDCNYAVEDVYDQFYGFAEDGPVSWWDDADSEWADSVYSDNGTVAGFGYYGESGPVEVSGYTLYETLSLTW